MKEPLEIAKAWLRDMENEIGYCRTMIEQAEAQMAATKDANNSFAEINHRLASLEEDMAMVVNRWSGGAMAPGNTVKMTVVCSLCSGTGELLETRSGAKMPCPQCARMRDDKSYCSRCNQELPEDGLYAMCDGCRDNLLRQAESSKSDTWPRKRSI